ncbi:hypothetical protein [Streptomyces albireticuli]|nr:hypothetical protein [Streptomyces albireticuli]MCD9146076.1 hypothetical protein [Streptomyces albireticuli]MCD9166256.1 hypothetical protein [Streptomyces albireticuli]MCD9196581.1 hypothetical protein [Streptomyces albireticuli]
MWDSVFYRNIALNGYPKELHFFRGDRPGTEVTQAFFPLYPMLMRWIALTGVDLTLAGMLISTVASLVAAWGLFKIGSELRGALTGTMLAGLLALLPTAVVQQLVYTESLFIALAVWTLHATMRHRWTLAGLLCVPCGLSRPTAGAVVSAVVLTALWVLYKRTDGWRPLPAIILSPLGLLSYFGYLAARYGRIDTYFVIQKNNWGETFDGGKTTWKTLTTGLTAGGSVELPRIVTALCLLALPALIIFMLQERLPLVLTVYAMASLTTVVSMHHWAGTIPRYLMPVFPLMIPTAHALSRSRLPTRITVLLTLGLASGWYAAWVPLQFSMAP